MDATPTTARPTTMIAARLHRRGGPEVMTVESGTLPEVGPADVLVEVHASGITPSELGWEPTWTNPDGSERIPVIPSHEVAGTIVIAGPAVDELTVGSRVFGMIDFYRDGAAAEYVAVRAADLAVWPGDGRRGGGRAAVVGAHGMAGTLRSRPPAGRPTRPRARRRRWRGHLCRPARAP